MVLVVLRTSVAGWIYLSVSILRLVSRPHNPASTTARTKTPRAYVEREAWGESQLIAPPRIGEPVELVGVHQLAREAQLSEENLDTRR